MYSGTNVNVNVIPLLLAAVVNHLFYGDDGIKIDLSYEVFLAVMLLKSFSMLI